MHKPGRGDVKQYLKRTSCASVSADPCAADPVVGPCKGTFPRWYYDQKARECKHFLYGGCQGNHNNFLQESDCVSECLQKSKKMHHLIFTHFF
uniref:BPTI/Kunitz inhibitor domain-containing protein n=1 Tax=Xiphophorus couchianus TaxID=32473 RepID=A0A3B5MMH8_9TELE